MYNKRKIFEMFEDFRDYLNIFLLVGRDINEILYNFEKEGWVVKD